MTVSNLSSDQVIEFVIAEHLTGEPLAQLTAQIGYDITKTFIEQEFEHFSKRANEFALLKISELHKNVDRDIASAKINSHLRSICRVTWPVQNGYPALISLLSSLVSSITNR